MPKQTELIEKTLDQIDQTTTSFNDVIPSIQKRLFKELQSMALKFDTDNNGNIKPTIKNLKLRNTIAVKVRNILKDPNYQKAVKDFTKEFGKLATIQDRWAKTIDKNAN